MKPTQTASQEDRGAIGASLLGVLSRPAILYTLALLLLAAAAIASHTVLVQSLSELDEDSLIINTSGRQRMLSEQTLRLAGEVVVSEDARDTQALKQDLRASLAIMRESHEELATKAKDMGPASDWGAQLQEAYFGNDPSLDARLHAYFRSLDTLLATPAAALDPGQEAYRQLVRTHRDGLLQDLDQIVQIHEAKAQASLEASEKLHIYLMLAMLALLLFEALFVFRPLLRWQVQANAALLDARDEAQAELAARTNILAAVSHEIRTPLSGVLGIIDQLKRERSHVERERALHLVEDSCDVLLDTLDGILKQARLGHGAEELSKKVFSPAAVANRVAELFRPVARRKALRIEVNAATDRTARGDDARIQQVLANLVSNAIKFTQSGAISIDVQEPGSGTREWVFAVSDTGAGMDEKRLESLFEPFGPSTDDTLGRTLGAGLGLSITRDLVEAMGGRIEVESELGKGSSFTMFIALADPPAKTQKPEQMSRNGFVALMIDRASERVQIEAVAVQSGYALIDLRAPGEPDLPKGRDLTVIADATLAPELPEDFVKASRQIIILGDDSAGEPDALGVAGQGGEKRVFVSHSQIARSLSELLKGKVL